MPEGTQVTAQSTAPNPASAALEGKIAEWTVNEPETDGTEITEHDGKKSAAGTKGGESEKFASMDDIIAKATKDAAKGSKEANARGTDERGNVPNVAGEGKPGITKAEDSPEGDPESSGKKKFKVKFGEEVQEYELTAEQQERFTQKGIYYEKKNAELAKRDREISAKASAAEARENEALDLIEGLKTKGLEALVRLHGEDKAREMMEAWLTPKVKMEMLKEEDPETYEKLTLKQRAEAAEAKLAENAKTEQEKKLERDSKVAEQRFQKLIIEALNEEGIPKTNYTAADMARLIEVGLKKKIEYTPQQLAKIVREDNIKRVNSLNGRLVSQILEAKKTGDQATILKVGAELKKLHGAEVMYAFAALHLAEIKSGQPSLPTAPLDTAKVKPQAAPAKRMTEDDVKAKRQRIVRALEAGQQVPENVWEIDW